MTAQLFDFPSTPAPQPKPKKPKKPKIKQGYTGEFLAFWELYPPRSNHSKFLAFKAWLKLDTDEQRQAMVAIPVYARSRIGKDQEYTKHAASWLNGKYFETVAVPRPVQPQTTINIHWPSVMKLYRITSNWRQEHGPAPGMKNCRVPKEYLSDM